jgi:dipeptidyl aminopeptidase/acylaminoacyl peptidase
MDHHRWPWLLATALFVLPALAVAQTIPVEDFARHAEINDVALSPDGKRVAIAVPSEDGLETQLHIVSLDEREKAQALRFGRMQHVTDTVWTANDHLVVSRASVEPLQARPYSMGELLGSDVTGKNQETLFAYVPDNVVRSGRRKDRGFASVVKVMDEEPGIVLVDLTAWMSRGSEKTPTTIYRVDTRTGERKQVEYSPENARFMFDANGRARLRSTTDLKTDDPVLAYRPKPDDDWRPVPSSLAGYSMSLLHVDDDGNTGYALISDHGEPRQLFKVDLAAGTRTWLAGRDDVDIASVLYAGRHGAPFGVVYDAGKLSVHYLDPDSEWAGLHSGLMKAFPEQMVWLRDFSRDNRKVLFSAGGARDPGGYYVLDRDTTKIKLINEVMPWMKPERLAPVSQVSFKTRDNQTLYGLYTAPAAASGPQPLVVMPHGGPHGPYDAWGYDTDAQFLASRGYAVLQVNYRGSGGRGVTFERSGYREWGGKMMDDIADGVRWAIDQKLADPKRICTYGASFGGYAALMNPIRYPELYRCAIGYVGVYDLTLMRKAGDIVRNQSGRLYLDRALGTDEANLTAWSPARNADKIRMPVMLVQGNIDQRVPMDQFNAMVSAFRKSGVKVQTMVANGEGHGFYKPENRAELYRRMEAFLSENIGPGEP